MKTLKKRLNYKSEIKHFFQNTLKKHQQVLTKNQVEFLNLIKKFSSNFYLVGETTIVLHLDHRQSIDFDLFSKKPNKTVFFIRLKIITQSALFP